jgi:hypothetical protein
MLKSTIAEKLEIQKKIVTELDYITKSNALNKLFKKQFVLEFINNNEEELKPYFNDFSEFKKNSISKYSITKLMGAIFTSHNLLKALLNITPAYMEKAFITLVNRDRIESGEFEKILSTEIIIKPKPKSNARAGYYMRASEYSDINPWFMLFCIEVEYSYSSSYDRKLHFYLTETSRKYISKYFLKPEDFELKPLDNPPESEFIFDHYKSILNELPIYYRLFNEGQIVYSKNGKPSKPLIKKLSETFNLSDFFPVDKENRELEYFKSNLIFRFLDLTYKYDEKLIDYNSSVSIAANLIVEPYKKNNLHNDLIKYFLNHLSRLTYLCYPQKKIGSNFIKLIKNLPLNKWITIDNIKQFIFLNDIDFNIIDEEVYFEKESQYSYRTCVKKDERTEIIKMPFLKGTFFLFAAFGILDIAYDKPKNKDIQRAGRSYVSIYDGLKAVRLNKFGAFLFKKIRKFEINDLESSNIEFLLDNNNLIITLIGEDKFKELILNDFGKKIANRRYRVDYTTLFQGCSERKDIEKKLNLFRKEIAIELPENWKVFFKKALLRFKPFLKETNYQIFKLKNHDAELLNFISTDPIISKCIIKAENYRILVKHAHSKKFKERMELFGYYM